MTKKENNKKYDEDTMFCCNLCEDDFYNDEKEFVGNWCVCKKCKKKILKDKKLHKRFTKYAK